MRATGISGKKAAVFPAGEDGPRRGGLSSKKDRYLVGQIPAKPWTPGPEDFQLLAKMFRERPTMSRRSRH